MTNLRPTDCEEFINDIDGGAFAEQLSYAVSKVASAAMETQKVGVITVQLKFSKSKGAGHNNITVEHKLISNAPLPKGKCVEEHRDKTPMYVNTGGDVSLFAKHTEQLFEVKA
ncbi:MULTISPECIES: hypothetical protein [Acinetobacter calcoaceticus/baumannii complex]|uniref:Uncharacterized protein n=4 Tax=Acinetobacter baumannii TaxID=470 RepID=A0A6I1P2D8_ACIBA|nr:MULTISPECIES: hypothetical protein [Acinetobacter calcoaceticus/baumannii complex]PXA51146.1 hypothetical protein DMB35_12650 [Acinetobacter baumannii A424]ACC57534.1 hypothetical protein ACICU_02222 [Acinetobacter baumannii ACICU]ACJ40258.1 hypothetical protein AB57_1235 [Acinetobacter baumannii AB0057]ALJ88952.1 hypothetical protein AN415_03052 [Acinetobacter baumannii]ASF76585.1 hypothetical protein CBI29_01204 [Acinetobacter baumannii]